MADALSRLSNGEPPDGIPDQTTDATLFSIEPIWLQEISAYLTTGLLPLTMSLEDRKRLVLRSLPFTMVNGQLYRLEMNDVLRKCIQPHEIDKILHELHEGPAGGHFSFKITIQKIHDAGYWWPTMYKDV